jgi:hypothetical protein
VTRTSSRRDLTRGEQTQPLIHRTLRPPRYRSPRQITSDMVTVLCICVVQKRASGHRLGYSIRLPRLPPTIEE